MESNPIPPAGSTPPPGPSLDGFATVPHQAGQVFSPTVNPTVSPTQPMQPAAVMSAPDPIAVPPPPPPPSSSLPDMPISSTPQPAFGVNQSFSSMQGRSPRRRLPKKLVIIAAAAVLVLLGGGAAAYFGYVQPNNPDNLWKTALSRTGKGYGKLTDYINQQAAAKYKGTAIKGSFKLSGSLAADGSFQGNSSGDNSEYTGSLSAAGLKVSLDLRTLKSTGTAPDVYFKVDGLQGLGSLLGGGDPELTSLLNGVDGNWYFVDHSLFDQLSGSSVSDMQFTSADINATLKAIGTPSRTYVFSGDPQKEIFTVKQKVGKEKQDGLNVYHYKVGLNKTNLKAYNDALCDSLKDTKLFKILAEGEDASSELKSCKDTSDLDSLNQSDSADVWVDTHTKLVHRVRFTDKSNSSSYFDIGQNYQGGDQLPFFIEINDKSGDTTTKAHIGIVLDMKANTLALDGNFSSTGGDSSDNETGTFQFSLGASNSQVNVEKPATSKNVIQLLNDLGLGALFGGSSDSGSGGTSGLIQSDAKDTERKTDINALQGQIEAYNAENGYYPSLAQINSAAFRAQNFKGLDNEALKDPDGTSEALVAKPAKDVYSYAVTPAGCDGVKVTCTGFTLSATLSDGSLYSKQNLD